AARLRDSIRNAGRGPGRTRRTVSARVRLRAGLVLLLFGALAAPVHPAAQQAPPSLVIRGVTLIDGNGHAPLANATVVVEGTRITQAGTGSVTTPAGSRVSGGRGKFLIPGLIDGHVHLAGGSGNRANTQPITPQQELLGVRALHTF